jgi:short-subunit dehydrogenase
VTAMTTPSSALITGASSGLGAADLTDGADLARIEGLLRADTPTAGVDGA